MTASDTTRIEQSLVRSVRAYLEAAVLGHTGEQHREEPEIAEALSRLLQAHLHESGGPPAFPWMDGVLVHRIELLSTEGLQLLGWAIERDSRTCEPFLARVQLMGNGDALRAYTLGLGDAAKGLQRLALNARWKHMSVPRAWLFTFHRDGEAP